MRRGLVLLSCCSLVGSIGPAAHAVPQLLAPPVDGIIERYFEPPASSYGPGHRGIDYGVQAGTSVRAAGSGRVSWAGPVAGNLAVTIDHGGGLETTYSILSRIDVIEGSRVSEGEFIGLAGSSHKAEAGGLHFGVKVEDEYVDPLAHLGPADVSGAIHLAPLLEDVRGELPHELTLAHEGAGALARPCREPAPLVERPAPPNDNIAVAIAGVGSYTDEGTNAKIFEPGAGPGALGYRKENVFRFSYAGTKGRGLHASYSPDDTWVDIHESALKLRALLIRLRDRFPQADVDLFAHSQGGLVARVMLEYLANSYDPRLPRVEHLVTYGTPHRGSPLAVLPTDLEGTTLTGRFLIDAISDRAEDSRAIPDPESESIDQMNPDSEFLQQLASEDVAYGTRVLALAMPHDVIVPADRALYPGKLGRMLSPEGLNGHDSVVASRRGRSIAYSFLRDAPVSCRGNWDEWGATVGGAVGWAQGMIADLYSTLETAGLRRAVRAGRWAGGKAWAAVKWTGESLASGARSAGRLVKSAWSALW